MSVRWSRTGIICAVLWLTVGLIGAIEKELQSTCDGRTIDALRSGEKPEAQFGDYDKLLAMWKSRDVRPNAKRQLVLATASRPELLQTAKDVLALGKSEDHEDEFAVQVLAVAYSPETAHLLLSAAENQALSKLARLQAVESLENYCDLSSDDARPSDAVKTIENRLSRCADWIKVNKIPSKAERVAWAAKKLHEAVVLSAPENSVVSQEDLEPLMNSVQHYEQFIAEENGGSSAEVADALVNHLRELQSIASERDSKKSDKVVAKLQFSALCNLQNVIGPIPELAEWDGTRDSIISATRTVVTWYDDRLGLPLATLRMRRLAMAGYRVNGSDSPECVASELLRAISYGSSAEAKAASEVLRELGCPVGSVPMPYDDVSAKIPATASLASAKAVDMLIRCQVLQDSALNTFGQRSRITWNTKEEKWQLDKIQ